MNENSLIPSLRFAGFTDAWERRKLGELADITTGKLDANAMTPDGEYDFYTCSLQVYKINKYAFEGPAITIAGNGYVGCLHLADGKFNAYQRTYVLSNFKAVREYLYAEIGNKLPLKVSQEARNGNIPYIVIEMLTDLEVLLPKAEEQHRLGKLLTALDTLITLHQRKHEKLRNIKKAMLDKMFPKNGELFPEVRFSGFTAAWERRKLGEIAEKFMGGGTPQTANASYWNGEIPWFQSSDFREGALSVVQPNKYISHAGLHNSAAQLIPANSIAIVVRVGVGKLALVPFSYATSQDFVSLCNLVAYPEFCVYAIYHKLQGELKTVQGTAIKGITKDDLLSKYITVARDENEQKQIGIFFSSLDNLITLHQRKLEKLQNIKKACLEEMFV